MRVLFMHEKEERICNLAYIHPLNRNPVKELAGYLAQNPHVQRIIIFGSSVTSRCHNDSDVDIYVELSVNKKETEHLINRLFDFPYDLWTNDTVDDRLKEEILKTGVIVYER